MDHSQVAFGSLPIYSVFKIDSAGVVCTLMSASYGLLLFAVAQNRRIQIAFATIVQILFSTTARKEFLVLDIDTWIQ